MSTERDSEHVDGDSQPNDSGPHSDDETEDELDDHEPLWNQQRIGLKKKRNGAVQKKVRF